MRIKDMMGRQHMLPYLKNIFYVGLIVTFIQSIGIYINYKHDLTIEKTRVKEVISTEGHDLNLICTVAHCAYIKFDDVVYKANPVTHILRSYETANLNSMNNLIWNYRIDDIDVYYSVGDTLDNIIVQYIFVMLTTIFLFTIFYTKMKANDSITTKLKMYIENFKLEGKAQSSVAESAYHEMMLPVAAIRTAMHEKKKYTLIANESAEINCAACLLDGINKENTNVIMNSIEQLESVLNQMSDSKIKKYSDREKTIYESLNDAAKAMQYFHINTKFEFTINNKDIADLYVTPRLENGTFLNILNNQFKNALEAGSTNLVFSVKKISESNKLIIFITDNGTGITGVTNETDYDKIFELGFSTKSVNKVKKYQKKSIFSRLLNTTINKEDKIDNLLKNTKTHRGFGLFISREILRHEGGDIKVVSTSKKGTVFAITVVGAKIKK